MLSLFNFITTLARVKSGLYHRKSMPLWRVNPQNVNLLAALLGLLIMGPMLSGQAAPKVNPKINKVAVKLFNQPCDLTGPFSVEILKTVHSISPEQMQPPQNLAQSQSQEKKLIAISASQIPPLLGSYKERLLKRVKCQREFFDLLKELAGQSASKEPIKLFQGKSFSGLTQNCLSGASVKAVGDQSFSTDEDKQVTLFEDFSEKIEPFPEDDFHQAIRKSKIQYQCSFDQED